MKIKIAINFLIVLGFVALLAGCESTDQTSASTDPQFPPAPANAVNAPQLDQSGTHN